MLNPTCTCFQITPARDSHPKPEVILFMNGETLLSPEEQRQLASQAGTLLLALGRLLADPSGAIPPHDGHAGQTLVRLGQTLLQAGRACLDS